MTTSASASNKQFGIAYIKIGGETLLTPTPRHGADAPMKNYAVLGGNGSLSNGSLGLGCDSGKYGVSSI